MAKREKKTREMSNKSQTLHHGTDGGEDKLGKRNKKKEEEEEEEEEEGFT